MNKWARRILIYIGLSIALTLFVISRLPSQGDLARKMARPEADAPDSAATPVGLDSPTPQAAALAAATAEPIPSPTAPADPVARKAKRAKELKMIKAIIDEDPRDIRVCNQLGISPTAAKFAKDPKAAGESISVDDLFGPDRSDSLMEAYRLPMRAIFQEPVVADLIHEVDGYGDLESKPEAERSGFLSKIGFYARVARAGVTLLANKQKYEELGDRANHLSVLAKMAMANPQLANDSRIMDFCRKIQDSDAPPTREGLRAEREELNALIQSSGMKAKDLDFDPEEWTKFALKQDGNQLTLSLSGKDPPK
jgi:hypothetical protein